MNRILTIAVITAVTSIMGTSIVAPAMANHGEPLTTLCPIGQTYDPNSMSCILEEDCPNGLAFDGEGKHCALDSDINDNYKVVLCHQPYKSNGDPLTIEVSSKAVEKHLAHGDTFGACYI